MHREGVCIFSIQKSDTLSSSSRKSVPPFYKEEADSFYMRRRSCLSYIQKGKRLLLYKKKRVSLSCIERRQTHASSRSRRETLSPLYREGVCLLSIRKSDMLLFITRRECHSSIQRGGRLLLCKEERVYLFYIESLLYRQEAYPFSMKRRERVSLSLLYRKEAFLSIYSCHKKNREEALSLLWS